MLRSQDVLIACKLLCLGRAPWIFRRLASSLSLSLGEVHGAVQRCHEAGLLYARGGQFVVARKPLLDACTVTVPQIFYAERGALKVGVPTSVHAECLRGSFPQRDAIPIVWPCEEGAVRGESLLPIYSTVVKAVRHDDSLYRLLALVDVVRVGSRDERQIAGEMLRKMIMHDDEISGGSP
jgi:hypothetical protein